MNQAYSEWHQGKRLIIFLAVVTFLVWCLASIYRVLLVPICLSLLFTYLFLPLVDRIHRRYRINRGLVSALLIAAVMGLMSLALIFLIPSIYRESIAIGKLGPQAFEFMLREWVPALKEMLSSLRLIKPEKIDQAMADFNIATQMGASAGDAFGRLWSATPTFVVGMVNLALLPLISFFLLRDINGLRRIFSDLVPRDLIVPLRRVVADVNRTIRVLLKGQITVALIDAALYMIGLSLVDLNYSLAVGAVAGFCRIIPYMDIIVGMLLSAFVIAANFTGWEQLIAVSIVFLVVQILDAVVITPRILGERVGLHPALIIISVIAFGDRFGFYGVLLAIPTLAVLKVICRSLMVAYRSSPWYNPSAALIGSHDQDKI